MEVSLIKEKGKDDVSVERGGGEKRELESREEPIQSSHYPRDLSSALGLNGLNKIKPPPRHLPAGPKTIHLVCRLETSLYDESNARDFY